MASRYDASFLISGNTVIALRHVESIRLPDSEETVVDKLKADKSLFITTVSGKEYTISVRDQKEKLGSHYTMEADVDGLINGILVKWELIMRGNYNEAAR